MKEIIILVSAFLVAAVLLWLAWKRPNRRRLFLRILASAGAVLSLALIALAPTRTVRVTATEAILLTPGYDPDTLQRIRKQLRVKPEIFSYVNPAAGYKTVTGLRELAQNYPQVKLLHVLGYGLEESELKQVHSLQIISHLNALPTGVISLDWSKQTSIGEKINITGRFHQPAATSSWLYLNIAGKAQDSVQIKSTGINRFTLSYLPKQAGHYVYALYTKNKNKRSLVGELPVDVKPKKKLRILLLPAGPSFEVKFLKNYLAAEQHGVALRIPVSKDIYQTEWLNLPQTSLKQLNAKLLQRFDLLITEGSVMGALSGRERQALTQAVQTDGLGIIIVPDALPVSSASSLFKGFKLRRNLLSAAELNVTPVSWINQANPAKTNTLPYTLQLTPDLKKVVWNNAGYTLVGTKRNGWGKVTVSLLPQTYTWSLGGNKSSYTSFWTLLLSQTGKSRLPDHTWHVDATPLPLVNHQLTLNLADYTFFKDKSLPQGIVQEIGHTSDTVYLSQQVLLSHRFLGSFWPRKIGWHQVNKPAGAAYLFYVFSDSSFTAWRIANRLAATHNYANTTFNKSRTAPILVESQPIPSIYFFFSFLVCAGFLWTEEKW